MPELRSSTPDPQYYLSLIRLTVTCHEEAGERVEPKETQELEQFARSFATK